eukprot:TRINITY_DN2547_c0_g2_i1.p2 TRINITY_DN2547_c0_g2~~TRINITY_DN2547_c0_g2_i1.p2  ORF type:complete len:141 (+),score=1.66 TRINITY_DN2547_c0_g2_i1:453-875(+)
MIQLSLTKSLVLVYTSNSMCSTSNFCSGCLATNLISNASSNSSLVNSYPFSSCISVVFSPSPSSSVDSLSSSSPSSVCFSSSSSPYIVVSSLEFHHPRFVISVVMIVLLYHPLPFGPCQSLYLPLSLYLRPYLLLHFFAW